MKTMTFLSEDVVMMVELKKKTERKNKRKKKTFPSQTRP